MNAEAVMSDHFGNKLCVTDSIKQPLWLLTTTFAALYAFWCEIYLLSLIPFKALNVGHGVEIWLNNRTMDARAIMPDDFCYELCVTESPNLSNSTLVGEKGTKKLAAYTVCFWVLRYFVFSHSQTRQFQKENTLRDHCCDQRQQGQDQDFCQVVWCVRCDVCDKHSPCWDWKVSSVLFVKISSKHFYLHQRIYFQLPYQQRKVSIFRYLGRMFNRIDEVLWSRGKSERLLENLCANRHDRSFVDTKFGYVYMCFLAPKDFAYHEMIATWMMWGKSCQSLLPRNCLLDTRAVSTSPVTCSIIFSQGRGRAAESRRAGWGAACSSFPLRLTHFSVKQYARHFQFYLPSTARELVKITSCTTRHWPFACDGHRWGVSTKGRWDQSHPNIYTYKSLQYPCVCCSEWRNKDPYKVHTNSRLPQESRIALVLFGLGFGPDGCEKLRERFERLENWRF